MNFSVLETLFHTSAYCQVFSGIIQSDPSFKKVILKIVGRTEHRKERFKTRIHFWKWLQWSRQMTLQPEREQGRGDREKGSTVTDLRGKTAVRGQGMKYRKRRR